MDRIINIGEYGSDQERRQALSDCMDIMLDMLLKGTGDKGVITKSMFVKELHNQILTELSQADPCVKNP